MTVREKIERIDNKIEQCKTQYNLDRQTAKIPASLSGNVGKYELLTGKDVLPEKGLLEESAAVKIFEYSWLGRELKMQTDLSKRQHEGLDKVHGFDKVNDEAKKKTTIKKYNESDLNYNNKLSFYKYYINAFKSFSLMKKYKKLVRFCQDLNEFNRLKP